MKLSKILIHIWVIESMDVIGQKFTIEVIQNTVFLARLIFDLYFARGTI